MRASMSSQISSLLWKDALLEEDGELLQTFHAPATSYLECAVLAAADDEPGV